MRTELPPRPRDSGPPEDNLDQLLRAFLRSEMPDPWPALKPPPRPAARPPIRRWGWFGSRFSLAATLALCLVGALAVTSLFPPGSDSAPGGPAGPMISEPDRIAPPVRPVIVTTPDNHRAKISERREGKITVIKVERLPDLPMMDD